MLLLEDINTDAMNLCYDRNNSKSHLHYLNVETVSCAISKTRCTRADARSLFLYSQNVFVCTKRNFL